MGNVNIILVAIIVGFACWGILIRLSPCEMRKIADYLNSRADAEDYWANRYSDYRKARRPDPVEE